MNELTLKFKGFKEIYDFNKLVSDESANIELVHGNHVVNAKSILGLLMLGTHKVKMKWNGDLDVEKFSRFTENV